MYSRSPESHGLLVFAKLRFGAIRNLIGGTLTTPLRCSCQCHDPGDHDHATDVYLVGRLEREQK